MKTIKNYHISYNVTNCSELFILMFFTKENFTKELNYQNKNFLKVLMQCFKQLNRSEEMEKLKIVVYKDEEYYDEAEINWDIYEKICDFIEEKII